MTVRYIAIAPKIINKLANNEIEDAISFIKDFADKHSFESVDKAKKLNKQGLVIFKYKVYDEEEDYEEEDYEEDYYDEEEDYDYKVFNAFYDYKLADFNNIYDYEITLYDVLYGNPVVVETKEIDLNRIPENAKIKMYVGGTGSGKTYRAINENDNCIIAVPTRQLAYEIMLDYPDVKEIHTGEVHLSNSPMEYL
jgi:hypothetical protein